MPIVASGWLSNCGPDHFPEKRILLTILNAPAGKLLPESDRGARALLEDTLRDGGSYPDVHGLVFTPASCRLILHDLKWLGLVTVDEYHMQALNSLEFNVALAAGAPGQGLHRMALQMARADGYGPPNPGRGCPDGQAPAEPRSDGRGAIAPPALAPDR